MSMGRNTGRGKVAYSWISPDPAKAGPTLGVVVVVVVASKMSSLGVKDATSQMPWICLLYTSPSPRDGLLSRMPSSA